MTKRQGKMVSPFFLKKNCIDELELGCISMSCLNAAFFIQRLSILGQVWRWNEWTTDRVPVAEYSNAIVIILSIQILFYFTINKICNSEDPHVPPVGPW